MTLEGREYYNKFKPIIQEWGAIKFESLLTPTIILFQIILARNEKNVQGSTSHFYV